MAKTFKAILDLMTPDSLECTNLTPTEISDWKIKFTHSFLASGKPYAKFKIAKLKMVVLGTSGLEAKKNGKYNSVFAFVADSATPGYVPYAVRRFINIINKATENNKPLVSKVNLPDYDFECKKTRDKVLFLNVCLSTKSSELTTAKGSIAFLNLLISQLKQKVTILDMRVPKTVHKDDLVVIKKEKIPAKVFSHYPLAAGAPGKATTARMSKNIFFAALTACYQNLANITYDENNEDWEDAYKNAEKADLYISVKEELDNVNRDIGNYYENLLNSIAAQGGMVNPIKLDQDCTAFYDGKFRSDDAFKINYKNNDNVDFVRIGNPGKHLFHSIDHSFTVQRLKEVNDDNELISQLYVKL